MKDKIVKFFLRYWAAFALILIVIFATQIRLIDYRWPYLRNIDSYDFSRQMEETVESGVIPPLDKYKLAPDGLGRGTLNSYIYVGAYSYLFFRLFMPGLQLYDYLVWFPALLAALMAIPMYFIGKVLYDKKAGLIAAAFVAFDTSIMTRTLGGDPDSDGITLLIPLIIIALFLYTYKFSLNKKFDKKLLLFAIITGVVSGLWRFVWGGFWFVIWLITGFILMKLIFDFVGARNIRQTISNMKHTISAYLIIMLVFFLITAPVIGLGIVEATVRGPIEFPTIKSESGSFPNVYVSVAELQNPGDAREVIARVGLPFFILVFSLFYLVYSYVRKRQHLDTMILLGIWFLGPFFATLVAVRFSILFAAPIAIGSGILFSKLVRLTTGEDRSVED